MALEKGSKENIIRERMITMLKQPDMTLAELEQIESTLKDVCFLIELNRLLGFQPTNKVGAFPRIEPNKFMYNSFGKNDMVCRNCYHFTRPETFENGNNMAKVCNDCFNGSAYHPYKPQYL